MVRVVRKERPSGGKGGKRELEGRISVFFDLGKAIIGFGSCTYLGKRFSVLSIAARIGRKIDKSFSNHKTCFHASSENPS